MSQRNGFWRPKSAKVRQGEHSIVMLNPPRSIINCAMWRRRSPETSGNSCRRAAHDAPHLPTQPHAMVIAQRSSLLHLHHTTHCMRACSSGLMDHSLVMPSSASRSRCFSLRTVSMWALKTCRQGMLNQHPRTRGHMVCKVHESLRRHDWHCRGGGVASRNDFVTRTRCMEVFCGRGMGLHIDVREGVSCHFRGELVHIVRSLHLPHHRRRLSGSFAMEGGERAVLSDCTTLRLISATATTGLVATLPLSSSL